MANEKPNENSTFFKGDFSFVNKDAKTINHKDHDATVVWHVMNRYLQWKKQQSAKSLHQSANVPVSPWSTRTPGQLSQARRERSVDQGNPLPCLPQSPTAAPETSLGYDPWGIDQALVNGSPAWEPPISATSAMPHTPDSTPSTQPSIVVDFCSASSASRATADTAGGFEESSAPGGATGHLFNEAQTIVDDPAAARAHLKMIRTSVAAQGGILLLDPSFRESFLSYDCYVAVRCRTRPVFPVREWTPGPLSLPWKSRLISVGILDDHVTKVDPTIKDPVLKSLLTDLTELFKAHEYVLRHDLPPDNPLLRWKQLRRFDCISRLGDLNVDLTIYPHLYEKPMTQFSVTNAASLLANMILGSPDPVKFGLELLSELRINFTESQLEVENDREQRLQLWVLYVGSLAENVYPVNTTDRLWFTSRLNKLVGTLELHGWSDMKKLLGKFLFCEYLHQEVLNNRVYRNPACKMPLKDSDFWY